MPADDDQQVAKALASRLASTGEEATLGQSATCVVQYQKTRIVVVDGPSAGAVLEVAGTPVSVGSSPENLLVLAHPTVSRRHCEIIPTPVGVRVRDAGSTNGVLFNGVRVVDATFPAAFQLRVGQISLSITPLAEIVEREQSVDHRFGDLIGQSACMRELFADAMRVAPTDVNVLIAGETGTGKELVADAIHRASARAAGPYIVFDCSSVTPSLVESELFGHERGAFTGAVSARAGVFEQADGGTIFFDELGELPRDLQPKLLRVLEKREVRRVGSNLTVPVNVRLIAATHRDLSAEVQRGNFREDLYFRIATMHIQVPPLRDRPDDLPLLVAHFLERARPVRFVEDIPEHIWEMFRAHRWPGNVRELQNAVQRFAIHPERSLSNAAAAEPPQGVAVETARPLEPLRIARREASEEFERNYLQRALEETSGNVSRAALIAEVSRQMMQRLVTKYGR